jgi:soluble lytic murein transglycosylase-like protein
MACDMSEAIKGKNLVERFNKFVEFSNASKKERGSFSKRLTEVTFSTEEKPQSKTDDAPAAPKPTARAGRRGQPPRLAKARAITSEQAQRLAKLAPLIQDAARKNNVPVELICGVILQESGGNSRAVSSAGAKGLMQLMPQTAKRFGVTNIMDPKQNIEGGTKYLRWLLNRFNGNIELALAGYNSGEANVEKHGNKVPPFAETKAYIPSVLGFTQTMIDVFSAKMSSELPGYARRV